MTGSAHEPADAGSSSAASNPTGLTHRHRFAEGDPDAPVLVLLHGTGGGPDDLLPLAAELNPASAVLAPAGQVSEGGKSRWFRRYAEGVLDHEDVRRRGEELADFLVAARAHYELGQRRMVAVGFSNGANVAAAVALLRPDALREVVSFAAISPLPDPPSHDLSATRVFLSNGTRDPMAPLDSTEVLVSQFRQRGAAVHTHRHDGGHELAMDGVREAAQWLAG